MSLRARLMAVGLTGVAGALLAGGLALYLLMGATLNRSLDDTARAAASEVAMLADAGRLPDAVPVAGTQVLQVLDGSNRVVAASAAADRLTALVTPQERTRLLAGHSLVVPGERVALTGSLRVVGVPTQKAGPDGARLLVVAAAPTADVQTSRGALRTLLLVFFPVVLAVMAFVAWRIIGAVLRPVEVLRVGAERIGAEAGEGALAVPPTRDEIAALARTLNGMLDRLATARRRQRAFVADAAHELRSPLATMRTQLEVAERLGEGGSLPRDLSDQVQRLSALVEDLLTLARADDAPAPPPEDVPVAELVRAVAARYRDARVPVVGPAGESGHEEIGHGEIGHGEGTGPGITVRVARSDLDRALTNLVDNAVRHARTGVRLEMRTIPQHAVDTMPGVELVVTDDGEGIPAADRERVFDRFARLDQARARDSGGTGLGLAITRTLVRRNGGEVTLEDGAPGLRAVIRLPTTADGRAPDHRDRPD